jgi:hypothetical protein
MEYWVLSLIEETVVLEVLIHAPMFYNEDTVTICSLKS